MGGIGSDGQEGKGGEEESEVGMLDETAPQCHTSVQKCWHTLSIYRGPIISAALLLHKN